MKKMLSSLKWKLRWKIEEIQLKKEKINIQANVLPKGKKIILVPHSDDEWIGCSKIICTEKNTIILNMDMSGNDKEEIHKIRFKELEKTVIKYNLKLETVICNKSEYIHNLIIKEKPKYICLPHYIDWHDEHIKVMNYLEKAIENIDNIDIIMYQVSLPIAKEDITHYLPLTKTEWKRKWHHFQNNYKTQIDFPKDRFAINEKINGKYIGVYAAEVFSIKNCNEWKHNYKKYILNEKEKQTIKNTLYSIKKTREFLAKKKDIDK